MQASLRRWSINITLEGKGDWFCIPLPCVKEIRGGRWGLILHSPSLQEGGGRRAIRICFAPLREGGTKNFRLGNELEGISPRPYSHLSSSFGLGAGEGENKMISLEGMVGNGADKSYSFISLKPRVQIQANLERLSIRIALESDGAWFCIPLPCIKEESGRQRGFIWHRCMTEGMSFALETSRREFPHIRICVYTHRLASELRRERINSLQRDVGNGANKLSFGSVLCFRWL